MMEPGRRDVVEANHRDVVGYTEPGFLERADCTDRGNVVVSKKSGKWPPLLNQLLAVGITDVGARISRIDLNDKLRIKVQLHFLRYSLNCIPAVVRVSALGMASQDCNSRMPMIAQMSQS